MEENGLEKDIILFRGTNLEGQINPKLFLPGSGRDSLSGSIIKDKGFLSTSRDISTADNFISLYRRTTINSIIEQIVENGSATDIPLLVSPMVKIKILARKKAHAYDIAAASKFGASEQEVLFASNTAMRIYEASAQKKEVKLTEYDIDTYDDKVKQKNRRKWKKIKEKLIGQTFSVYMPELSVEIV